MFDKLKNYVIKKFLVQFVLKQLDQLLAKLPANYAKTAVGILIAVVGVILQELPSSSDYLQPILDALHSLPAEQIAGGGIAFALIGIFHKILRQALKKGGEVPKAPVVKAVIVDHTAAKSAELK